jgi:hypothetical protein
MTTLFASRLSVLRSVEQWIPEYEGAVFSHSGYFGCACIVAAVSR